MARSVGDALERGRIGACQFDDLVGRLDVRHLVLGTNVVDLAGRAGMKDQIDRRAVVFDEQHLAHLHAIAIERQVLAVEGVGRKQGDQLLGKLVRAIRVRTAGDRGVEAKRPRVREHEQIAGGL